MSDRLREVYEKKAERELRRRVNLLPWNKKQLARMREAGKQFKKRHPEWYDQDEGP